MANKPDLNAEYHNFRIFGIGKPTEKQIERKEQGIIRTIIKVPAKITSKTFDVLLGTDRKTLKVRLANAKAKRAAKKALSAEEESLLANEDVITDDSMYDENGILIGEGVTSPEPAKSNLLLYGVIGVGSLALIGILIYLATKPKN